ncbi:MAG: hypothetical protein HGGPFJEG_02329 [Ignavibacteria bacterium]|nr:hypothetical protein [Ignavibacteria bacterium]
MTVVNALIFDKHSGAMCCDEQTSIGEVRKMLSSDKIQKIVPSVVRKNCRLEAVYGGSGTTAIGDEIRRRIKSRIRNIYESGLGKNDNSSCQLSIDEIFKIAYDEMMNVKHKHINDIVNGYFNFDTSDYVRGYYNDNEKQKIEIKQKEIKEKVFNLMNWNNASEVDSIFLNSAIIGGFDESGVFKICKLSMKTEMLLQMPYSIFETIGSGSDSAQIIFSDYIGSKTLDERRNHIDKIEGMIQLLRATNAAAKYNMGVGGYFNIVLFDSKHDNPDKRFAEILNSNSKLASEVVFAYYNDFINYENTYSIINELVFKKEKSFDELNRMFFNMSSDKIKMQRFLRGYKVC